MSLSGPHLDLKHTYTELSCVQKHLHMNGVQEETFKFENEQHSSLPSVTPRRPGGASQLKNIILRSKKNFNFIAQMKNLNVVKKAINNFKNFNSSKKPEKLNKFHYDIFDDLTINPFSENISTKV
jgi:hypothetical protein